MKVKKLRAALAQLDDNDEVLVWTKEYEKIHSTYELTVDTDMRNGDTVIVICASDTEHGNLRDYEPHPAFENLNQWQHGEQREY